MLGLVPACMPTFMSPTPPGPTVHRLPVVAGRFGMPYLGYMRVKALDHRKAGKDRVRPLGGGWASQMCPSVTMGPAQCRAFTPSTLLGLQAKAGNQAVTQLLVSHLSVPRKDCCASCSKGGPCRGAEAEDGRADASFALQRTIGDGHDLTSPRLAGDLRLEACFDDEARLRQGDTGESVAKVQGALIELGYDLGRTGADGIYGQKTWNAVKAFKKAEQLGWEQMGDVGPGTMRRLNELFPAGSGGGGGLPPCPKGTPPGDTVVLAANDTGVMPAAPSFPIPNVTCVINDDGPPGSTPPVLQPPGSTPPVPQCPNSFPVPANTFFGRPIPSASGTVLREKLLEAQQRGMREMCVAGRDPSTFVLSGSLSTYKKHSPGMDKAVDIDVTGQPYIMHEFRKDPADPDSKSKPEADIDRETEPVYDRIAFWSTYRTSIIPSRVGPKSPLPSGINSVSRPRGTSGSQRTWKNPLTGVQEPTDVGKLYDLLAEESKGMHTYFDLLRKADKDLAIEIEAFLAFNPDPPDRLSGLGLPTDESSASVSAFRRRIADDYRLLGGSVADLTALAGGPTPSTAPPKRFGDRPFEGRKPEEGFLTMPREVVVAMTDVGLRWGAIDFAGASGDVMHVDCRNIPGC